MTPHEEIEFIANTAYLRGCDSNFKTAIAAMQESEKDRLNVEVVLISSLGVPTMDFGVDYCIAVDVFGATSDYEAAKSVYSALEQKDQSRLAELVRLVKGVS